MQKRFSRQKRLPIPRMVLTAFLASSFLLACDSKDELTSVEAEIIACFGEDFPTVPASGASGRGFTAERMRDALFGPDPADVPSSAERDERQLSARAEVFAGISEDMYETLQEHLRFLDNFFSRSATSTSVPSRMRLFRERSMNQKAVYYTEPALNTRGVPEIERTSREKLTLRFDDWDNWGTIVYTAAPTTLDVIEDLLADRNPGFAGSLEDTVTIAFYFVNRASSPVLRYRGEMNVDIKLNRLQLAIAETAQDRNITVGGTATWSIPGLKLETLVIPNNSFRYPDTGLSTADWDALEVEESGSLAGRFITSVDLDLAVDTDKNSLQSSSVTELRSGLVAVTLDKLVWGLGGDRIELNGEIALSAEGGAMSEAEDADERERSATSIAGSGAVRDLRLNIKNGKGQATLSTSGRLRVEVENTSSSHGDAQQISETGDGILAGTSTESVAISMPCGVSAIQFTPATGNAEKASLRFHGRFVQTGSRDSRSEYFADGAYESRSNSQDRMRLENFVFEASVAGAEARGRMPAYVQESSAMRTELRRTDVSGNYLTYADAETNETRIAKSGYVGFDGKPAVFWTPNPLRISRTGSGVCCADQERSRDVDASGSFEFVSGGVMRMALGTRNQTLVRDYTVDGIKIEKPVEQSLY